MSAVADLKIGVSVYYDGHIWDVAGLVPGATGPEVLLQGGRGRMMRILIAVLLAEESFRIVGPGVTDVIPAYHPPAVELSALTNDDRVIVDGRTDAVREVLTGFRSGHEETQAVGEPRAAYRPGTRMVNRYEAKGAELGVSTSTIRNWVRRYQQSGPAGLVDGRAVRPLTAVARADSRWVDVVRGVLEENISGSRPTMQITLMKVEARLADMYGPGVVPIPSRSQQYQLLNELSRGTNAFVGSTKGKRSIANRPASSYGRLRSTRPGENLMLDTNNLDIFAMDPTTLLWVRAELTVAMDHYSRTIVGLRVTPSTKSVDVGDVLREAVDPATSARAGDLPYAGVPSQVVVDADRLETDHGPRPLPSVAAEAIIVDHGKIYVSDHVYSACERHGISVQPARPYTPTDKAPVERFFRTLNDQLLVALPGFKGPDVHSRGQNPEGEAFYFIDELEQIIREWITTIYHVRKHAGLCVPEVPGLDMSPLDMFEHGLCRAGHLRVPTNPNAVFDWMEVEWRTIQHYGVELEGLRYNGPALDGFRNTTSPYGGRYSGKWPFSIDPRHMNQVYFQHPTTGEWSALTWEHQGAIGQPFSLDALKVARRLAATTMRFPDDKLALIALLNRWNAGLSDGAAERRKAMQSSFALQAQLGTASAAQTNSEADDLFTSTDDVRALPTVARVAGVAPGDSGETDNVPTDSGTTLADEASDDDSDDDLLAEAPDEYYDDAMESL